MTCIERELTPSPQVGKNIGEIDEVIQGTLGKSCDLDKIQSFIQTLIGIINNGTVGEIQVLIINSRNS